MPNLKHLFVTRPRLAIAIVFGVLCYALLPASISGLTRGLCGWNVTAWLYLVMQWWLMLKANPARIRHVAQLQDESAGTMLTLVSVASVMCVLAILFELAEVKQLTGAHRISNFVLTGITLLSTWILMPTAFAIHYAHLFYGSHGNEGPIIFPGKEHEPVYWDFLYFSFTIAVASQTADVAVGTMRTRRVVLAQSVLAFVFNLMIVGLSINVIAGLLS